MLCTTGIELSPAVWALISAVQVFLYSQFMPAHATENCLFTKFTRLPSAGVMVSRFLVTLEARIVFAAAFKPDGDYVQVGMIVNAPRVLIDWFAKNSGLGRHQTA
jgi:hypothetical protein